MFKLTLRRKLLLIASSLLLVPFIVYEYVIEIEGFLKNNLEQTLMLSANSLAIGLHNRPSLIDETVPPNFDDAWPASLLVDSVLDGYEHEWADDKAFSHHYVNAHNQDFKLRLFCGKTDKHIQFLLKVSDPHLVYSTPDSTIDDSDNVIFKIQDKEGENYYIVAPEGDGRVVVHRLSDSGDILRAKVAPITAYWRETEYGYNLELRFSESVRNISFVVTNKINASEKALRLKTARDNYNQLLVLSSEAKKFMTSLIRNEGQRLWLLDAWGRVIHREGELIQTTNVKLYNPIVGWLMTHPVDKFIDPRTTKLRLESADVQAALSGQAASGWLQTGDKDSAIASAAHPIFNAGDVVGAIVMDQASTNVLMVQRKTFVSLLNYTLLLFSGVLLALFLFSGRLSFRIRALRDYTESISLRRLDEKIEVVDLNASDEVGDLSRSYQALLLRLKEYQDYLNNLAGRLSHEIRTPLAIIGSSLDLLNDEAKDKDEQDTLKRAKQGVLRLSGILARMREASSLIDSIEHAKTEIVDVKVFFTSLLDAYRMTWSKFCFSLDIEDSCSLLRCAPELLAQALDKLIENAVEYSTDQHVALKIENREDKLRISCANKGPIIPADKTDMIFDSLVSLRGKNSNKETHLGLGLYVVKKIVEFHDGTVRVENLSDREGVNFIVELPLCP